MSVTILVNCQLVAYVIIIIILFFFNYQSVLIRAANKQSWCYVMYGSEREREKETRLEKESKKVLTVKGKRERERKARKKGSCFIFIYLFISAPSLTPVWQRLARKGSTPLPGKHRRDSCACCSILDSSQQYTGPDFGVMAGTYPTQKISPFLIFRYSSKLSCSINVRLF